MTSPIVSPLDMSTRRRIRRQSEASDGSVCSKSTEPGNYSGSILDDSTAVVDESKVILDETHISDCSPSTESSRDSSFCVMETQPSFMLNPNQSPESPSDTNQRHLEESMGLVNSPNNTSDGVMGDSDSDHRPALSQTCNPIAPIQVSLDQSKKSIDLFESDEDEPTPPVSPPHFGDIISVASPGSVCSSVMDSYPLSQPITPAIDDNKEDLEIDHSPSEVLKDANNSGDSATPPSSPPAFYQAQQNSLHEEPVNLQSPISSPLAQANSSTSKQNQEKWSALYTNVESDDDSDPPTSPHLLSTSTPCPNGTLPISLEADETDAGDGKQMLEMDQETDVMSSQSSDESEMVHGATQERHSPVLSLHESLSMVEDSQSPRKKRKIVRRSDIIAAATAEAGPSSSPRRKQASPDHSANDDSESGGCDMEQEVDVTFSDFSSRSASASDSVPMELCTPYEPSSGEQINPLLEKLTQEHIDSPLNPQIDQEQDLMDEPVPSPLLSRRSAKSTRGKSLQSGTQTQNSRNEKTPELPNPLEGLSDTETNEQTEVAVNEAPIQPVLLVNKSKARRGRPFHHAERREKLPRFNEPEAVANNDDSTEPARFAHPLNNTAVAGTESGRLTRKTAEKVDQSDAGVVEPNPSNQSNLAEEDPSVKKRAVALIKNSDQPVAPLTSPPVEAVLRRSNRAPVPNVQLNVEEYEVPHLSATKPPKTAAEAPKGRGRPSKVQLPKVPEPSSPRRARSNKKEGNQSIEPPENEAVLPVVAQNMLDQSAEDRSVFGKNNVENKKKEVVVPELKEEEMITAPSKKSGRQKKGDQKSTVETAAALPVVAQNILDQSAEDRTVVGKNNVEIKNKAVVVPGSKEEEMIAVPPKKSGRQKKSDQKSTVETALISVAPPVAEVQPAQTLADQTSVLVPRKRGRPKKADKNSTETAAVLNTSEIKSPETKSDQSATKTPKKRGRPTNEDKKLQLAALAAAAAYDQDTTDTESTIMEPPKPSADSVPGPSGRGRLGKGKRPLGTLNTSTAPAQPRKPRSSSNSSICSNNNATASESDSSTKVEASRRKKRALAGQVRVVFTGAHDENLDDLVEELGGRVVSCSKDCSVLVTDNVRRTVKFLCVVGLGLPIVDSRWLVASKEQGKFVDPWKFLLVDKEGEKKFKFKLEASLKSASEKPLLAGWTFGCTSSVTPPPGELKEIVEAAGGSFAEDSPTIETKSTNDNRLILVSCADDRKSWPKWTKKGFRVIDKEAILIGVLRHNFQPDEFPLR